MCSSELPMWFQLASMVMVASLILACSGWGMVSQFMEDTRVGFFLRVGNAMVGVMLGAFVGAMLSLVIATIVMSGMFLVSLATCL